MYRIFCESFQNYIKAFEGDLCINEYRYMIAEPLKLIIDLNTYNMEKEDETFLYKQLSDLLHYMSIHVEWFPKFKAFLWTLESRGITGKQYNLSKPEELDEQAKLVNMMLNLVYWQAA